MKTKAQKATTQAGCKARENSKNTTAKELPPPRVKRVFQGYHKDDHDAEGRVPIGYAYAIYQGDKLVGMFKDMAGIDPEDMFHMAETLDLLHAGENEAVLSMRAYCMEEEAAWVWDAVTRLLLKLALSAGRDETDSRAKMIGKLHACTGKLMRGERTQGISDSDNNGEI